jgi:hypothetical protein
MGSVRSSDGGRMLAEDHGQGNCSVTVNMAHTK